MAGKRTGVSRDVGPNVLKRSRKFNVTRCGRPRSRTRCSTPTPVVCRMSGRLGPHEEGPGDFNQPHRLVADAVVTLPLDSLGRLHDLEVLLSRAREAQASCALDLTTWRDLGALVHVIENDCRQLHARYMSDRTHLLTTANRMAAGIRAHRRAAAGPREVDRQPPSTFPPYRRVPTGQTHDYLRHRAVTRGSRDRVRRYAVCAGYVTNDSTPPPLPNVYTRADADQ